MGVPSHRVFEFGAQAQGRLRAHYNRTENDHAHLLAQLSPGLAMGSKPARLQSLGRELSCSGSTCPYLKMLVCNTDPMLPFRFSTSAIISNDAVLALYESVGWSAYASNPELLCRAIKGSSFVVTAWSEDGRLIGLARAVSDDATICYVQDILVNPDFQGAGLGRGLFAQVTERYQHVRQTVLITDDQPKQRAFYESMGLAEGSNFAPEPIRVFARFR
ncbi:GNAT family N-acetyltransferase [Arthrobacter alpinus]|nr:GNAT family N-acetyltransferase [Arthrobacter alpinus]